MKKVLYFCTYKETIDLIKNKIDIAAQKSDISIDYNCFEKINLFLPNEGNPTLTVNGIDIKEYSFVYFLGWGKFPEITAAISRILKTYNIRFADTNSYLNTYGGKLLDMSMAKEHSISIPDTLFLSKDVVSNAYSEIKGLLGDVFVMKGNWGRKGEEVWLIKSQDQFSEIVNKNSADNYIFQKFIPNNFDYRIVTLNYKASVYYKRIRGEEEEFRNNIAKGATREFLDVNNIDPDIIKMAEKISSVAFREIAGVDIIKSTVDNKYYFIELNAPPGVSDNPEALSKIMEYFNN